MIIKYTAFSIKINSALQVFSLQKMQIIFIALFSCSCTEISLSDKKLH